MNTRLWSAHIQTVALKAELKAARKELRELQRTPRCAYCGYPCPKGRRACVAHSDLVAVDSGAAA